MSAPDPFLKNVTYHGNVAHSRYSAEGLQRAELLKRYSGPFFLSRRLPGYGKAVARLNSARVVPSLAAPYRPAVLSEGVRYLWPQGAAHARRIEERIFLRGSGPLVAMADSLERPANYMDRRLIIERRANSTQSYREAISIKGRAGSGLSAAAPPAPLESDELSVANGLICYSRISAESYSSETSCEIKVVHLGAEPFRGRYEPRTDAPRIGFVGRPDYWKGFDRFLSIAKALKPASAIFIGDQTPWTRENGRDLVRSTGRLNRFQLENMWTQMDYLILPSRIESFGLVAYEALSRGVIPVVSRSAGVSEPLHTLSPSCVFDQVEEAIESIADGSIAQSLTASSIGSFCHSNSWERFGDDFATAVLDLLAS